LGIAIVAAPATAAVAPDFRKARREAVSAVLVFFGMVILPVCAAVLRLACMSVVP
jgi:hypothetical protein